VTTNWVEIELEDVNEARGPVRSREMNNTHISVVPGTCVRSRSIHALVLSEKVAMTSSGTPNTGVVVIVVQSQEWYGLTPGFRPWRNNKSDAVSIVTKFHSA